MNMKKTIHRQITVVVEIDPQRLEQANKWLRRKRGLPDAGRDELLDCVSVKVDEYFDKTDNQVKSAEVDIKVCNSDQRSGPYVDPVLFIDGCEAQTIEVCDAWDGEYHFQNPVNCDRYIVVVKGQSPAPNLVGTK